MFSPDFCCRSEDTTTASGAEFLGTPAVTKLIGIALLGDFDTKNEGMPAWKKAIEGILGDSKVTPQMTDALIDLVKYLSKNYRVKYLGGHKEFHQTLNTQMVDNGENRFCPGDKCNSTTNWCFK